MQPRTRRSLLALALGPPALTGVRGAEAAGDPYRQAFIKRVGDRDRLKDVQALGALGGDVFSLIALDALYLSINYAGVAPKELPLNPERQLADGGLRVAKVGASPVLPGLPELSLTVGVLDEPAKPFSINAVFLQTVYLERNGAQLARMPTWRHDQSGRGLDKIPDTVRRLVDRFLADWRAANRK